MNEPISDTFDGLPQLTFEQSWLDALADGLDEKPIKKAIAVPGGGGPPRVVFYFPRNGRDNDPRYSAAKQVDGPGVRFYDCEFTFDQSLQRFVSNDVASGAP